MNAWQIVSRYAALEKRAGHCGDWKRAQRVASHVRRAADMYDYNHNPY